MQPVKRPVAFIMKGSLLDKWRKKNEGEPLQTQVHVEDSG